MMDIQAIKTEQDYDRALSKIADLWGVDEGTEDGDKLDVLLILGSLTKISYQSKWAE